MTWVVPPEWCGDTAFLLGCGPSLAHVPVHRLHGHGHIIAINDAFHRVPDAEVLYICDRKFWRKQRDRIADTFTGRYLVTLDNILPGAKTLRCTGAEGLETDPACLRHGSNGGYQAINLAYHFGARRIVLLGYDMHVVDGRGHWQEREGDYVAPEAFQRTLENVMLPKFQSLAAPLTAAGVEVLNATPGSSLQVWPITRLEDVLTGTPCRQRPVVG